MITGGSSATASAQQHMQLQHKVRKPGRTTTNADGRMTTLPLCDPGSFLDESQLEDTVNVNVSGTRYQLLTRNFIKFRLHFIDVNVTAQQQLPSELQRSSCYGTLEFFMRSGLTTRLKIADHFIKERLEYYFDRDATVFDCVLQYYRTGQLHIPNNFCPEFFLDELRFWRIDPDQVADCCSDLLDESADEMGPEQNETSNGQLLDGGGKTKYRIPAPFRDVLCGELRHHLYLITEDPTSSRIARAYAAVSIGAVLISVFTMILASLPSCQMPDPRQSLANHNNTNDQVHTVPLPVFQHIELACILWFTSELTFRFVISPRKLKFLRQPLNLIDLCSVLPFWIELIVTWSGGVIDNSEDIRGALLVLRVLRVLRVMRVFKLARYSGGISSLGMTLTSSIHEIGLLFSFMSVTIILYSTTVYYLEKDEPGSKFISIPATFWWCIVTMTTVGYGDMVPQTVVGKMIATLTSISGVIVLAFPITLIVENFNRTYTAQGPGVRRGMRMSKRKSTKS